MEEGTDEILELAIYYVQNAQNPENERYPPGLSKDRKRAVRKRAKSIVPDRETGKVFMKRNEKSVLVEVVRSVEDQRQKIKYCHSGPMGHLGVTKTQKAVAERFYWKGMADDVREYIRQCPECQKRNCVERGSVVCSEKASFPVDPVIASSLDNSVRLGKRNGETPSGKPAAKIWCDQREYVTGKEGMASTPSDDMQVSVQHRTCSSDEVEHRIGVPSALFPFSEPCHQPGNVVAESWETKKPEHVEHMAMECSEGSAASSNNLLIHHPDEVDGLSGFASQFDPLPALRPPAHFKPWHESVHLDFRQKLVMKLYTAREKYLTVECVDMRDVIDEEQLLFERAGSWEEYYSLVREKIRNVKGGIPLLKPEAKTYSVVPPCVRPLATSYSPLSAPSLVPTPLPDVSEEEMLCDLPSVSSRVETSRMETESRASSVAMTVDETPPTSPFLLGNETKSFSEATSSYSYSQGVPSSELGASREAMGLFAETPPTSPTPSNLAIVRGSCAPAAVKQHTARKMFTAEELDSALRPVLEAVRNQDPQSYPFREPVDPKSLEIPDYFEIIRHPMDLGSMSRKLKKGEYKSPWEFCKDMWLMFDNAWLYNKKTSRVYRYCSKLSKVFDQHIDDAMKSLGYCCGQRNAFKEVKNGDYKGMVECIHCGQEVHKICVLHHDLIWPDGYQCDECLKAKGMVRKENQFTAERLPTTKLSDFLEKRVNALIGADTAEISIRVVFSSYKTLKTQPNMRKHFRRSFPEQVSYRGKTIFAFQKIDGSDVCFFAMHVQEYGSDCPAPNARCVYISYLDSVHFFRPCHLRTQVYHEILIGYLQFCKDNGFLTAHIWACPPKKGDDYIFHCHPAEQKIPQTKRLVEWYKKMLEKGKAAGVVWNYQDILQYCNGIKSVSEIPYFKGDFWSKEMEDAIEKLNRETQVSKHASGKARGSKKARSCRKAGSGKKMNRQALSTSGGDSLLWNIHKTMKTYKEEFFVVRLQPPAGMDGSPLPGTSDPDQLIQCDLMDGRDAFLTVAQERHWEFSSLRRARYSTMAMLYELHSQIRVCFATYNCSHCHRQDSDLCRHCNELSLDDDNNSAIQTHSEDRTFGEQEMPQRPKEHVLQQCEPNTVQISPSDGTSSQSTLPPGDCEMVATPFLPASLPLVNSPTASSTGPRSISNSGPKTPWPVKAKAPQTSVGGTMVAPLVTLPPVTYWGDAHQLCPGSQPVLLPAIRASELPHSSTRIESYSITAPAVLDRAGPTPMHTNAWDYTQQ